MVYSLEDNEVTMEVKREIAKRYQMDMLLAKFKGDYKRVAEYLLFELNRERDSLTEYHNKLDKEGRLVLPLEPGEVLVLEIPDRDLLKSIKNGINNTRGSVFNFAIMLDKNCNAYVAKAENIEVKLKR